MAFDFSQIKSWTIPEGEVQSVSIGGVVVWSASPTLLAPTISIDESLLTISTTDARTEEFAVFVDGVEKAKVSAIGYTSGMVYEGVYTVNGQDEDGNDILVLSSYTCVDIGDATDSVIYIPKRIRIKDGIDNMPVTAIGYRAFYKAAIAGIVIPETVTIIDRWAVTSSPTLQKVVVQGIAEIRERAFTSNTKLHTVELNDNIAVIGSGAFNGCTNLKKIALPNRLTSLEYEVFGGSGLTEIAIPDSVNKIGAQAFDGCKGLTSVTIGSGVTEIGNIAFRYCTSLTSITFNGTVDAWYAINKGSLWNYDVPADSVNCNGLIIPIKELTPTYGLAYSLSDDGTYYTCTGISDATATDIIIAMEYEGLPVSSIGDFAFYNCTSFTSVIIPYGVTSIGSYAFNKCTSLTSVEIVEASIGNYAFQDCESLTKAVIYNGVKKIGSFAFLRCTRLTSIVFKGTVEQWNAISKDYNWNGAVPASYVQCTDGTVEL